MAVPAALPQPAPREGLAVSSALASIFPALPQLQPWLSAGGWSHRVPRWAGQGSRAGPSTGNCRFQVPGVCHAVGTSVPPSSSPSQGSNTLLSKPVREIPSLALALFVHFKKPFPSHLSLGDEFLAHILHSCQVRCLSGELIPINPFPPPLSRAHNPLLLQECTLNVALWLKIHEQERGGDVSVFLVGCCCPPAGGHCPGSSSSLC